MAGEIYFNNLTGKFDWSSLVDQIIKMKSAPLQRLSQEAYKVQTFQAGLSKLAQAVNSLSSFLDNLDVEKVLNAKRATSSHESIVAVVASDETPNISFRVRVEQISQKEVILSNFSTPTQDASISWNTFTIRFARDYGQYQEYTIEAGSGKLIDLVNRINQVAGEAVQASLYFDGNGYRLMLSEASERASRLETDPSTNTFVVSEASPMSINGVYGLDYTSPIQLAKNAKIRVGDSASLVVSPSNTFENLIDGLSITVKGVGESIVSVSKDASKVSSAFMDFVRGFNAVISEVNKLTAKDAPFQGDYTVTGIKSSLTRMIDDLYKYDLVSVKEDGTLELNTSTINSMYNSNPEGLKHILQGLKKVVGQYLRTTSADLERFNQNYSSRLEGINNEIERLRVQIVKEEERLRLEYAKVEAFINRAQEIMSRMQAFIVTLSEMQGGKKP